MAKTGENGKADRQPVRIEELSVEGFKSIDGPLNLKIRPLTILAGANSSGKSSAIQPLLMMKQTLEAPYDPGPLLLSGPNVNFTSVQQFLCLSRVSGTEGSFAFGLSTGNGNSCRIVFHRGTSSPVELEEMVIESGKYRDVYRVGEFLMSDTPFGRDYLSGAVFGRTQDPVIRMVQDRFLINAHVQLQSVPEAHFVPLWGAAEMFEAAIAKAIHVPGLRGNPLRNYPVSAVGARFPGTFEKYVASIVATSEQSYLDQLGTDLQELGLTWKVTASKVDDTQVELKVGRLPKPSRGGANDLVSIADVGFGVSQTLPVVVALLTARPGQLVYIEQPEIHLHPRAQVAMAALLARAANRGVQVVIETHSSLLLLGVQQLIASGELDPSKVWLHWFKRDDQTGFTDVTSREFDEVGRFGDWPEDFDDVSLEAQQKFLDAAEKKLVS